MIKLSLNLPVNDLAGKPIEGAATLSQLLSQTIAAENLNPAIKWLDWAMTLFKTGEIQVDASDFDLLYKQVEKFDKLTVLAKGQLLQALQRCKDQSAS